MLTALRMVLIGWWLEGTITRAAAMTEEDYDRTLGALIRRYRAAAGLSQGDLGRLLGVSYQQVQKYELGTNRVHVSRLIRLAAVLGVPAGELLEEARQRVDSACADTSAAPELLDRRWVFLLATASGADAEVRDAVAALLRELTRRRN